MQIFVDGPPGGAERYLLPEAVASELEQFQPFYEERALCSGQGFLLQNIIETGEISVFCCRYNFGGMVNHARLSGITQKSIIVACYSGSFSIRMAGSDLVQDYQAGYAGYVAHNVCADVSATQFRLNLGPGSGFFVVIALDASVTRRLAAHFPFWFAVSKTNYYDARFPRYACRVDESLYLSFLPRVEKGRVAGTRISEPVYALAEEIGRIEEYRDAVSPGLSLFPGFSKPNDFAFQYALTHSAPGGVQRLPRYFPGYEYGMDKQDYYLNDEVTEKAFANWARRKIKHFGVFNRGISLSFWVRDRNFEHAAPDIMAQAHRWFPWQVARCSRYCTIYSTMMGSTMKLSSAKTNRILRMVIERPRLPRKAYFRDAEFERQRWRAWMGNSGEYTGTPNSMIDLTIMLQQVPRAIRFFLFNVEVKVALATIQNEKDKYRKLMEELRQFPLSIFFMKRREDRNMLLWGGDFEFETPSQLPDDLHKTAQQYIFNAARCLLIYCANLGVNPRDEISRLKSEYGAQFKYEELMHQHELDMHKRVLLPVKVPAGDAIPTS